MIDHTDGAAGGNAGRVPVLALGAPGSYGICRCRRRRW